MKSVCVMLAFALLACAAPALSRAAEASHSALEEKLDSIHKKALPCMVSVVRVEKRQSGGRPTIVDDFLDDSHGAGGGSVRLVRTSGVLVSADGLVVTVSGPGLGGGETRVVFGDGREFEAVETASDKASSLSLLRIRSDSKTPFLEMADMPEGRPGSDPWGVIIGEPRDFECAMTFSMVRKKISNSGRVVVDEKYESVKRFEPLSGCPVVDLAGRVIGVVGAGHCEGASFPTVSSRTMIPARIIRDFLKSHSSKGPPAKAAPDDGKSKGPPDVKKQ